MSLFRPSAWGQRLASLAEAAKASFGFPTGVAIVVGLVAGFGMPAIDAALFVDVPVFEFDSQEAARGMLETVATVTVAVAGLAFSVTVVAFTLASNQLSPRVLRSFRTDRVVQLTLATFIGTFIYSLSVMVRLGAVGPGGIPNLSITLLVILAVASFALFAGFIAHIVTMLQPSSVIAAITEDAAPAVESRFPAGIGEAAGGAESASSLPGSSSGHPHVVTADDQGYLTLVTGDMIVEVASGADALVRQRAEVGEYVLPGQPLADVYASEPEQIADEIRNAFTLGRQRTFIQDPGFGIRQLADIALKGVSPGINDPTTARNAMEALTGVLVRFARTEAPDLVRLGEDGAPRFVASAPSFDQLVRLGFEEVRGFAASHPEVLRRLIGLLERLRLAAAASGATRTEVDRQTALVEQELRTAA